MTLIAWPAESWRSRAIRVRSSAAASRRSRSASRSARSARSSSSAIRSRRMPDAVAEHPGAAPDDDAEEERHGGELVLREADRADVHHEQRR